MGRAMLNLRRVIVVWALLFGVLSALFIIGPRLVATAERLDLYLSSYERELDRAIRLSEISGSYDEFTRGLELRMNVLTASWERDRDRLNEEALQNKEENAESISRAYDAWEDTAAWAAARAKAEYLVRYGAADEGAFKEGRERLMAALSERYRELVAALGGGANRGEVFDRFRRAAAEEYGTGARTIEEAAGLESEARFMRLDGEHGRDVPAGEIRSAVERERDRLVYERKIFFASLLNASVNRAAAELFRDRDSLRQREERERAARIAREIEGQVQRELAESVHERLDALLAAELIGEGEPRELSGSLKGLYDEGLEKWARAAADLVKREREWYKNYDAVYGEGVAAWANALETIRARKEEWAREFGERVGEGLSQWERAAGEMENARESLLSSLKEYSVERERDFETYIRHVGETMTYGSGGVQQIDAFEEEFKAMLKSALGAVVADRVELDDQQVSSLIGAVRSLIFPEGVRSPLPQEGLFWAPDKNLAQLFDVRLRQASAEHHGPFSAQEYVKDAPVYYLLKRERIDGGFQIKMRVEATVVRYEEVRSGALYGGDILWFEPRESVQSRCYAIRFVFDRSSWSREFVYGLKQGAEDAAIPVNAIDLNRMVNDAERYRDILGNLDRERARILSGIASVQDAVAAKLAGESLLADPVLTSDELFRRYYFDDSNELFLTDFEKELYRAHAEKGFWERQERVVDQVLEYALEKAGRENAEQTVASYERARRIYDDALDSYTKFLDGTVKEAENAVHAAVNTLAEKKMELAAAQEELRDALRRLSQLKIAAAGPDLLVRSMAGEVARAVEFKHAYLEGLGGFSPVKQGEAAENLLKAGFDAERLLYERLYTGYFDETNRESLVSMEGYRRRFGEALLRLSAGGGANNGDAAGVTDALSASALTALADALEEIEGALAPYAVYRQITACMGSLDDTLRALIGSDQGGELKKIEIVSGVSDELSLIEALFDGLVRSKEEAYAALYARSADTLSYLAEGETARYRTELEDLKGFLEERRAALTGAMPALLDELSAVLASLESGDPAAETIKEASARFIGEKRTALYASVPLDFGRGGWVEALESILKDEEVLTNFSRYMEWALDDADRETGGGTGGGIVEGAGEHGTVDGSGAGGNLSGLRDTIITRARVLLAADLSLIDLQQRLLAGEQSLLPGPEAPARRGVEEMLLELRERDPNSFLALNALFTETLPAVSEPLRESYFASSRRIEKTLVFYEELAGGGLPEDTFAAAAGGVPPSGVTVLPVDLEGRLTAELSGAFEALMRLSSVTIVSELLDRWKNNYYSGRRKSDIEPLDGTLDGAVIRVFSDLSFYEKNGLLAPKLNALIASMTDYIASALCLTHEDALRRRAAAVQKAVSEEDQRDAREAFGALVNEKLLVYFSGLAALAEVEGYSPEERDTIRASMEAFLVTAMERGELYTSPRAAGSGEIGEGIGRDLAVLSGMNADEVPALTKRVETALAELDRYGGSKKLDVAGYAAALLSGTGFVDLEELEALFGIGLAGREELRRQLKYAQAVRRYGALPTASALSEICECDYIIHLFETDRTRARDLIVERAFLHLRDRELPLVQSFPVLYAYVRDRFAGELFDREGGTPARDREEILGRLLSELHLYEARLKQSGGGVGYAFSDEADAYGAALTELESAVSKYEAGNDVALEFGKFVEFLTNLRFGQGLAPAEVAFIRERRSNAERYAHGRRFFVGSCDVGDGGVGLRDNGADDSRAAEGAAGDDAFAGRYLGGFGEDFSIFLQECAYPEQVTSYEESYRLYLLGDPLAACIGGIARELSSLRELLASASRGAAFKMMIEDRVAGILGVTPMRGEEGAVRENWEDARGVISEHRSTFVFEGLDPDALSGNREVDPEKLSAAYNYLPVVDTRPEAVLSRVFLEGPGTYAYSYNGGKESGEINTAVTYVSGEREVNGYIEFQNRFAQALVSLAGLGALGGDDGSIEERARGSAEAVLARYKGGGAEKVLEELNLWADPRFSTIGSIRSSGALGAFERTRMETAFYAADLAGGDRDGSEIVNSRFADGELLYLIASVEEALDGAGTLGTDIRRADTNAAALEGTVERLEGEVKAAEQAAKESRDGYNGAVDRLQSLKERVDAAYGEYLAAKEVYFYAKNIYLAGDEAGPALDMYTGELAAYAANHAEAEARYTALKDILMGTALRREEQRERVDELARSLGLVRCSKELEREGEALNEVKEALFLLKVLNRLVKTRMDALQAKRDLLQRERGEIDRTLIEDQAKAKKDRFPAWQVKELARRSEALGTLIAGIDGELDSLGAVDRSYTRLDLSQGASAHEIFMKALSGIDTGGSGSTGAAEIDGSLARLSRFLREKGGLVFRQNSEGASIGLMAVELESYVRDREAWMQGQAADATRIYGELYRAFNEDTMSAYAGNAAKRASYRAERELVERERGYRTAALKVEERSLYEEYRSWYRGRWSEIEDGAIDEPFLGLLLLDKREEELGELEMVYGYLCGDVPEASLKPAERERLVWLKAKYGIDASDVVRFEDVVLEGTALARYDLSERGLIKKEVRRKEALLGRLLPLSSYNTIVQNGLFEELLGDLKGIYSRVGEDEAKREEMRFDLQAQGVLLEKERFLKKVGVGEHNGLRAWEGQYVRVRGEYRKWLAAMGERLSEGEQGWHEREVEYVKKRDEWARKVREGSIGSERASKSGIENEIEGLLEELGVGVHDLQRDKRGVERAYVREVTVPQWVGDYEVAANMTFGRMKKSDLGESAVDEAVAELRVSLKRFEEAKENLEVERQYYALKEARDRVLAEIRGVDEGNRRMIEGALEEGGWASRGEGYEKRAIVDYSLLGGKKRRVMRIGRWEPFKAEMGRYALPTVEEVRGLGDSEARQVFVLRETERLLEVKEEVLGEADGKKIGVVYLRHIGRLPTGGEVGRYVEDHRKTGLFGGIAKLLGKVMGALFKKKGGDGKGEEFDVLQEKLQGAVSAGANKSLETGRILLEYQRVQALEAEAEEKAEGGFFNVPLFPGGPSLKSIGSVALSVVTGGASTLAQSVAQLGWSTFTTAVTHAEGKISDEAAALSIFKDVAVTGLTGGFGEGKGVGGTWAERKLTKLSDMGSLTSDVRGVMNKAFVDAGAHLRTQVVAGAVRSLEMGEGNRLVFDAGGYGVGLLSTAGAFGGSYVRSRVNVFQGAGYDGGGGFTYFDVDGIAAGRTKDMLRLGNMVGGLTEQAINNAVGAADGFTVNVANSRMFGANHESGILAVTVGGRGGFTWDASTEGVDVSLSGLKKTFEGMKEAGRYQRMKGLKEQYQLQSDDKRAEFRRQYAAYVEKNLTAHALDGLEGKEFRRNRKNLEQLMGELDGMADKRSSVDVTYGAGKNERVGDRIYVEDEMFVDSSITWDLSTAARISSVVAHEWRHDGKARTYEEAEAVMTQNAVVEGLIHRFGAGTVLSDQGLMSDYIAGKIAQRIGGEKEFMRMYVKETHDLSTDAWKFKYQEGKIAAEAESGDTLGGLFTEIVAKLGEGEKGLTWENIGYKGVPENLGVGETLDITQFLKVYKAEGDAAVKLEAEGQTEWYRKAYMGVETAANWMLEWGADAGTWLFEKTAIAILRKPIYLSYEQEAVRKRIENQTAAQEFTRKNPDYQPGSSGPIKNSFLYEPTWCNQSSFDVLYATGVHLETLVGPDPEKNRWWMLANDAAANARESERAGRLRSVKPERAQKLANLGIAVTGIWQNPNGHGHMVTVMDDTWGYNSELGPKVSNVGKKVRIWNAWEAFEVGGINGPYNINEIKWYYDPYQIDNNYSDRLFFK